jgi:hypothetical protein
VLGLYVPGREVEGVELKRKRYEPPRVTSLGVIFEPIERSGDEFAVRLPEPFFALPSALQKTALELLMQGAHARDVACHELILYDARDGRRIGRISQR